MALRDFLLIFLLLDASVAVSETLHYKVSWSGISAGEMVLHSEKMDELTRIHQRTWSTGFFSKIFPMEDTFISIVENEPFRTLIFVKDIQEKSRVRYKEIYFWWEEKLSFYDGKFYPLPESAVDTLSSIYLLRKSLDHLPIDITVHDRGKTYVSRIDRSQKVYLMMDGRRVETLKVIPRIVSGEKKDEASMTIWFSSRPGHVPVKLKFKATIGSLTAELDPYCE